MAQFKNITNNKNALYENYLRFMIIVFIFMVWYLVKHKVNLFLRIDIG